MLNLIDIDKTAMSQPVIELLSTLELKHTKEPTTYNVKAVPSVNRPEFWQLRFSDPRFTEEEMPPVAVVEWTYGSRSEKEYKIASRKIQNARYGYWGNENSARRTKDVKKAVKIALEALAPYEWHEISNKDRKNAEDKHRLWTCENSRSVYPFNIGHEGIYEEIKHLVEQGVVFKTEAFKSAAAGIQAYDEHIERMSKPAKFDTVIERDDKIILIKDGRALEAQELSAMDALPESTRNSIALLKLVGENSLLPEVGFRAGVNTYFVYA
jgi:hypothetical protein